MRREVARSWLIALAGAVVFAVLVSNMQWWETGLAALFPDRSQVVYPRATLLSFTREHLALVGVSSAFTVGLGLPLGIWATRRSGRSFRPLIETGVDVGQTFPPVAVLALALPLLGFGFWPTIVALVLYGLFPVVSNTVAGLGAVSPAVLEAARGMGMSPLQVLFRVELPLAARVIMAGIRTSVVINIGTATIGAAIGAGGLGDPIIVGLVTQNMSYVLEGAIPAALLAIVVDALLASLELTVGARRA